MKTINRLLIIDDEEIVRDSIREILNPEEEADFSQELGMASSDLFGEVKEVVERNTRTTHPHFEITEAKNGEEGLQKVKESIDKGTPFNVIFIDMRMPGWDGLTTCVKIRKVDPKAQISFITAFTDRSIEEIIKEVGGDVGYLSKPFIPEEIIQLATKGLYDWARLTNLEKLLEIIGHIGLGTTHLKTLLTNIQHQIADYIGTDYSILGKAQDGLFEEISVMGVGEHRIRIDVLLEKVNLQAIHDIRLTEGVLICPLEPYYIIALPTQPELFNQEKIYLLRLFVENAVRAIRNSELNEELVKREKLSAVGQAISMVMHDIRNPIAQLKGLAELIKSDPGNKEENGTLATYILEATNNATDIITDVMDFTKNASIYKKSIELKQWVDKVIEHVRKIEEFEKVDITVKCSADMSASMDVKKMDRALINLIKNACEALVEHEVENPRVQVLCEETESAMILKISDNGPGIPDDIKLRLFDAFVTSNKAGGTGLGLAIVKQIIDAHEAYIKINQPKVGAEFEIGLPK
jgi:signal transduction histidine kinase